MIQVTKSKQCENLWKFVDFSVSEILREINFGEFKVIKVVILTLSEALNFDFWDISAIQNLKNPQNQNSVPLKIVKIAVFRF